jgi:hypothetical protein
VAETHDLEVVRVAPTHQSPMSGQGSSGVQPPGISGGGGGSYEDEEPIRAGLLAGARRLARYGIEVPWDTITPSMELGMSQLHQVQEYDGEEASPRAVELFAELLTVGATMRAVSEEAPLKEQEILRFLREYELFINHFWRPPPVEAGGVPA